MRFINIFGSTYYDLQGLDPTRKKDILWKLKRAILNNTAVPECMKPWVDLHKFFLIPATIDKSIPYDCQKSPYKYIAHSFYMNQQYETFNESLLVEMAAAETSEQRKRIQAKTLKLFQPLSLRSSSTPKYVTFDT